MKRHKSLCPLSIVLMLAIPTIGASDPTKGASDAIPSAMPPFSQEADMDTDAVMQRLKLDSKGLTPTIKDFDRGWVKSLFTRGEPSVYGAEGFDYIGMPIGGLTSGQLYLGGDGKLWHWDIFNTRRPTHVVNAYRMPRKQYSPVEQGFAIRTTVKGQSQVRTLDRHGFSDISFLGQYPIGYCTFKDADARVMVKLEAYSPFIPLNLNDSSFPATVMQYTVKNVSDQPVEAAVGGWLENWCTESAKDLPGERSNQIECCPEGAECFPNTQNGCPSPPASSNSASNATAGEPCNAIHNGAGAVVLKMDSQLRDDRGAAPETFRPEIVFEDFEGGTYNNWTIEGDAFGQPGASLVRHYHHQTMKGFKGKHLADSFLNASDKAKGKLISKPFTITRQSIHFLIGGGNHQETSLRLIVEGKVERKASGNDSETLLLKAWDVSSLEGKTAVLEIVDDTSGGWGHVLVDHIVFTDKPLPTAPFEKRLDHGTMALTLLGTAKGSFGSPQVAANTLPEGIFASTAPQTEATSRSMDEKLVGALGRRVSLQPGESKTITFIVSWYFPKSHIDNIKTDTTRWYATRFKSAWDVSAAIVKDFKSLTEQTRLWKETWYDSTLPYWFMDRTFLNTSILASETCFRFADGRFYGMEGIYCCAGTCTHVWGYVQATGRLFPDVEKALREKVDYKEGIAFYPDTGAISFRGDVYNVPSVAVDGQSGVILRTYREHQMSMDDAFLRRNYPLAKKALNHLIDTFDSNADGIMEGGQHNTLDAHWYGKITWLSLYYCAALRAMECMAMDMGDTDYAKKVRMIADRGGVNIGRELYNGEYFIQKPDPEHPDSPGSFDGCEYSQLLGQGWAYQVGLGRIIENIKVKRALRSLWRYNFSTDVGSFREKFPNGRWYAMPGEGGLIACTFPHGGARVLGHGNQHFAGYMNECQNGYEYGATSLMMWEGMVDYALAHTRTLHDRYHPSLRNPWNEIECGEHYARSMASYGLFTAICGFEYHGPKHYMAFSPRLTPEDFRAPFTSAAGWGTFSQERLGNTQTERLDLRWGELTLQQMAFDIPAGKTARDARVSVSGEAVNSSFVMTENRVMLSFAEPVTIKADQAIDIRIQF